LIVASGGIGEIWFALKSLSQGVYQGGFYGNTPFYASPGQAPDGAYKGLLVSPSI
jgi:hypothetical protein